MNLRKLIREVLLEYSKKKGKYIPVPGLDDWYVQRREESTEGDHWMISNGLGYHEKIMGEIYDDGRLILYPLQDIPTDENPAPSEYHPELVGKPFRTATLVWLKKQKHKPKEIRQTLSEILWVNGIGLDDDQILVITTGAYFGSHLGNNRYFYNRLTDKFVNISVIQNKNINLAKNGFFCGKADISRAKEAAKRQDLDYNKVELGKIRGYLYKGNRLIPPQEGRRGAYLGKY